MVYCASINCRAIFLDNFLFLLHTLSVRETRWGGTRNCLWCRRNIKSAEDNLGNTFSHHYVVTATSSLAEQKNPRWSNFQSIQRIWNVSHSNLSRYLDAICCVLCCSNTVVIAHQTPISHPWKIIESDNFSCLCDLSTFSKHIRLAPSVSSAINCRALLAFFNGFDNKNFIMMRWLLSVLSVFQYVFFLLALFTYIFYICDMK